MKLILELFKVFNVTKGATESQRRLKMRVVEERAVVMFGKSVSEGLSFRNPLGQVLFQGNA